MKATLAGYTGITAFRLPRVVTPDIEITDAASASEFSSEIEISTLAAVRHLYLAVSTARLQASGPEASLFRSALNDDGSFIMNGDRSDETVTLDSDNDTLTGLRNAINNADINVTASS